MIFDDAIFDPAIFDTGDGAGATGELPRKAEASVTVPELPTATITKRSAA